MCDGTGHTPCTLLYFTLLVVSYVMGQLTHLVLCYMMVGQVTLLVLSYVMGQVTHLSYFLM